MTETTPPGARTLNDDEAHARWSDAWRPEQVAERLDGVAVPWCVAAGWALDLFRGEQSRPHGDLEVTIPAAAFPQIRERFPELAFDVLGSGYLWEDSSDNPDLLAGGFQTWARDPETRQFRFDVMREPHDGDTWICRRDPRLRLPYDRITARTADGIPYLLPELALLFKAKAPRPKDEQDFTGTAPLLDTQQREFLRTWIDLLYPGHAWSSRLAALPPRA